MSEPLLSNDFFHLFHKIAQTTSRQILRFAGLERSVFTVFLLLLLLHASGQAAKIKGEKSTAATCRRLLNNNSHSQTSSFHHHHHFSSVKQNLTLAIYEPALF